MTIRFLAALLPALLLAPAGASALEVFACEPEWAALAAELGGPDVEVFAATTARQDPHQIQARPALIARMRAADLVVCTGAELEAGWLPILLRQGANPRVQPGSQGYFEAASFVTLKEVPARLDRADGDVHAAGNPHIHTDPRNVALVARALGERLARLDPAHAEGYGKRRADFVARMEARTAEWERQAAPLRGTAVAVSHKSWVYLLDWLGMTEAAAVEPKPGVPAGAGHIARLVEELPARKVRMILYAAYQDGRPAQSLAERTGARAVALPFTVGGDERAGDLFGLYDETIRLLLAAHAGN
jgi:zinc/manganese transport system substrate-binding protein